MLTDDTLDRYLTEAVEILGIPLRPEWRPAVREHLAVTLRVAAAVSEFPLPDDAEPAPVFRA